MPKRPLTLEGIDHGLNLFHLQLENSLYPPSFSHLHKCWTKLTSVRGQLLVFCFYYLKQVVLTIEQVTVQRPVVGSQQRLVNQSCTNYSYCNHHFMSGFPESHKIPNSLHHHNILPQCNFLVHRNSHHTRQSHRHL